MSDLRIKRATQYLALLLAFLTLGFFLLPQSQGQVGRDKLVGYLSIRDSSIVGPLLSRGLRDSLAWRIGGTTHATRISAADSAYAVGTDAIARSQMENTFLDSLVGNAGTGLVVQAQSALSIPYATIDKRNYFSGTAWDSLINQWIVHADEADDATYADSSRASGYASLAGYSYQTLDTSIAYAERAGTANFALTANIAIDSQVVADSALTAYAVVDEGITSMQAFSTTLQAVFGGIYETPTSSNRFATLDDLQRLTLINADSAREAAQYRLMFGVRADAAARMMLIDTTTSKLLIQTATAVTPAVYSDSVALSTLYEDIKYYNGTPPAADTAKHRLALDTTNKKLYIYAPSRTTGYTFYITVN